MVATPTMMADLIDPEVLAPMVAGTLPKLIRFSPIAHIDRTLEGRPGDTITIPKYGYIGAAEDVAEGADVPIRTLSTTTTKVTIKKAAVGVELTDEAKLSGYGNPEDEIARQLAMSIADKIDNDCYTALQKATLKYDGSAAIISYDQIVDAVDVFGDENDRLLSKVMWVNPAQVTQLRHDANFLDINKYPIQGGVVMTGVIGTICGCQIIPSKKVALNTAGTSYVCPITIITPTDPNTDPAADKFGNDMDALSIYMKRDVLTEADRDIVAKKDVYTADEHYGVSISNDSKVVLASFKAKTA